jgi:hypothetical protein
VKIEERCKNNRMVFSRKKLITSPHVQTTNLYKMERERERDEPPEELPLTARVRFGPIGLVASEV